MAQFFMEAARATGKTTEDPWNRQSLRIALAVLPFIPFSVAIVTYRYLRLDYAVTYWISVFTIALLFGGVITGWLKDFPRWSYPYLGLGSAMIGLFSLGRDSDMTSWENIYYKVIFVGPFILALVLVWWLIHRSHPLRYLFRDFRKDWTLFPFLIFSLSPLVINFVFTNIRSVYGAPFLAAATLATIAGVLAFMLFEQAAHRYLALIACMTLVWLVSTIGSATFWHGQPLRPGPGAGSGYQIAVQYAGYWAIMFGFMLLPLAVRWVRRFTHLAG